MIYGIQDFDFVSATEGHVLSNMGEIFGTVDGGLTWTLEYAVAGGAYGPSVFLVSISFSGNTGYVCGSSGLIKKYTEGTTGLQVAAAYPEVRFFPNPVSGTESYTIAGLSLGDRIEIYNQAGQSVFQKFNVQTIEKLQLNLSAGVYSVRVISDQHISLQKLMIVD
jgi:Secretion system C-terminal sorting domain